MFIILYIALILAFIAGSIVIYTKTKTSQPASDDKKTNSDDEIRVIKISILTNKGEIKLALRPDLMPITVANFMFFVRKKFYNNLIFHRVELWLIQGGDPTGTGRAVSDHKIRLEISKKLKHFRGAIAMARSKERNSASTQFYILKKNAAALNGNYAVFGNVISGMEVVDKIQVGDGIISITELID